MSLPARAARLGAPLRRLVSTSRTRHASSQATPGPSSSPSTSKLDVKPQAPLDPKKLRTLVSLYHNSVHFIPREGLSDAIDQAFIGDVTPETMGVNNLSPETPLSTLYTELERRNRTPRFGEPNRATARTDKAAEGQVWSEVRSPKELKVIKALYGVEGRGLPGYDTVKEEEERVREQWKQDREQAYE